ncbi:hypothetical protein L1887_51540 [Cichorium endivia]|nr:hypothetical protein L1887_51540 [Cichorium endivia]
MGEVEERDVEGEVGGSQTQVEQDVQTAQTRHEATGARGGDQFGRLARCALAELEVCAAQGAEGQRDKEQDPNQHHVGPERGEGQEVRVHGPPHEIVAKGHIVRRGTSTLCGQQGRLNPHCAGQGILRA